MREIKFRAWDRTYKAFISPDYLQDYRFSILHNVRYEFTQYTGLKDKNGKEIYGGDIVRVRNEWVNQNYEIVWEGCSFVLNRDTYTGDVLPSLVERGIVEVIGNIYENPELVKKEDKKL